MSAPKLSRHARINLAFDLLLELIDAGSEYPDAIWAATWTYGVEKDSEEIAQMYMDHCA